MQAEIEAPLTIGQVARRAGVGVETVRFYEREGLVAPAGRRRTGYRQYRPDAIQRIRFIREAKEVGFSLKEIAALLALRVNRRSTCADARARAEAKLVDIEEKIRMLERMRATLRDLAEACVGQGPTSECPILEALDRKEERDAG